MAAITPHSDFPVSEGETSESASTWPIELLALTDRFVQGDDVKQGLTHSRTGEVIALQDAATLGYTAELLPGGVDQQIIISGTTDPSTYSYAGLMEVYRVASQHQTIANPDDRVFARRSTSSGTGGGSERPSSGMVYPRKV